MFMEVQIDLLSMDLVIKSILIYNDQHIHINGLEPHNSHSHLDSSVASTITAETPNLFSYGRIPHGQMSSACEIGDGNPTNI